MPAEAPHGRPVVLLVDDDPDLRHVATRQLERHFEVVNASSGRECLEMVAFRAPDVILLDMMMPGMSGLDVLDRLVTDPATAEIPVVLWSGLTAIEDRVKGLERGAIDYITKTADPRELLARVSSAARLSARRERLRQSAGHDAATGLPGRARLDVRLENEMTRSEGGGSHFSVLLVALDSDDEEAPARLRELAAVLRRVLRTTDAAFGYSPTALAVILPETAIGTAAGAAERIRSAARSEPAAISVSVGLSDSSHGGSEEILRTAELALFRTQRSDGNLHRRADDPRRRPLSSASLAEDLTDREWEILGHLAQRRTEIEISNRLGISPGTVRSHKARIRRKLDVPTDVRLADHVRSHFRVLAERLGRAAGEGAA